MHFAQDGATQRMRFEGHRRSSGKPKAAQHSEGKAGRHVSPGRSFKRVRLAALEYQPAHFCRIVTNSSAAVGCRAMVASKSALVAPVLTAIPRSWAISPA